MFHLISEVYAFEMQKEDEFAFDTISQQIYNSIFELEIFPFFKKKCFFNFKDVNFFITQILCLEDVYKIFERC